MSAERDALRGPRLGDGEVVEGQLARRDDADASDGRARRVVAGSAASDPPAVVTDASIAATAGQIQVLAQRTQLALAFRVGEIVIENLYGGDLSEWRSRRRKSTSLRALAERLREIDSMSAATLFRCIATYELLRDHGGVAMWKHVSVSHVRTVLPLRDEAQEIELLRRAEDGEWPVRELARRVRAQPVRRKQAQGQGQEQEQPRALDGDGIASLTDRLEHDANALLFQLREGAPGRRGLRQRVFAGVVRIREALDAAQSLTSPRRHG